MNYREIKYLKLLHERLKKNIANFDLTRLDSIDMKLVQRLALIETGDVITGYKPLVPTIEDYELNALDGLYDDIDYKLDHFSNPILLLGISQAILIQDLLYSYLDEVKKDKDKEEQSEELITAEEQEE